MENLKLNETPVRTSRNFNINNIKLEDINILENIPKFENIKIENDSSKIYIDDKCSKVNLQYGLNDFLESQVNEKSNQNLHIIIDSKSEKQLQLHFYFDKNNMSLVDNIEIVANENTNSTVIIKYESEEDLEFYHNAVFRVNAEKGAKINIIFINLLSEKSNNFVSIENNIEKDANVKYTVVDFGGKNSISNLYSNIKGEKANNVINAMYLGKENQILDLNYIAELRGEKSNINIEVQGALKDNARKHFKGTIDFKKGCKKAKGNENENCMLLSDTARSLALPMLLCSEEDVEGNHSTSSGKIGEKELFYIMSRGFEEKEAQKLLVRAKFNKILATIKNEEIKLQILETIDKRLD